MVKKLEELKIAIIGLGNMGEALLSGLLERKVVTPEQVVGVEARAVRQAEVSGLYGIKVTDDAAAAAKQADIILMAVKPKDAERALSEMELDGSRLVVSICAGLTLDWFSARTSPKTPVVRVMPNTPALVGQGASVYCAGEHADAHHSVTVEQLLGAVGKVFRVDDEKLMDAVTGLSGSGPAYVFLMLEALADGGVAAGLPRGLARDLAVQTLIGAATMAAGSVEHTAELKDRVCSPAGTTIEGVRVLEGAGLRTALIEAVVAATERSRELGG